jgi:tripartite-type tricarboxylate transporter receptor subunit TctC
MKRLLSVLLMALAIPVAAQNYPNKSVKIIVPYPAGGNADNFARTIAQKLNESYGQILIVDNRPGATGTIGAALAAKSLPDGYTLIEHIASSYIAGFLYRDVPYDPAKAFAPIINCAMLAFALVAASSQPAKTVAELIALARRRPNEVTYSSAGSASAGHLVSQMFNSVAGIKTVHVPYKGSAPAMIALASGEAVFGFTNMLDPQPFLRTGKIRALAVTGAKRSPTMPDAPTMNEAGLRGFEEVYMWLGIFAPAGTPKQIVDKLNADIARILNTPKMKEWLLRDLGGEFTPNTPDQFNELLVTDTARWMKIIKETGVHLD